MDDLVIRGATVIDGTGAVGRIADVSVRDGRISAVEPRCNDGARREIDAAGRVLAPGFIDIHTHSDFTLPLNPMAEAKIRQGVTTEVVGNCGFSVAPTLPGKAELLAHYLSASAPWLPFSETDFAAYMAAWPEIAVNTVMQVGHNTLRLMAMGMDNRPPGDGELRHMQEMLDEALAAGALGMSTGLFTPPGLHAEPEEIRALGQVLKRHGARYSSHIRDESHNVHEAVAEAIDIGESCGIHVQIAHLKLSGIDSWGGTERLLDAIEAARARGVDVHCDQYPYDTASNPLRFLLPPWIYEGGMEANHALNLLSAENMMIALLTNREKVHKLLEWGTKSAIAWSVAQIRRGCDAIKISSPWVGAGLISPKDYTEFVVPYERELAKAVRAEGGFIYTHTCGAISDRLESMMDCGINGLECLDPPPLGNVELPDAIRRTKGRIFIKGNIDSVNTLLNKDPAGVKADVRLAVETGVPGGGYICSSACSIAPHVKPENIKAMVETARAFNY